MYLCANKPPDIMQLIPTPTTAALIPAEPVAAIWTYETILSAFIADQPRAGDSSKALYSRTLRLFFLWIEAQREREKGQFSDVTTTPGKRMRAKKAEATPEQKLPWDTIAHRTFAGIERRDVVAYRDALREAGKSSLTIGGYLTAIRQLFIFAEGQGFTNAAKGIRTPTREQKFRRRPLSDAQLADLLAYAGKQAPRDRAILTFFALTGCRTIEGVRANVGDMTIRGGKCVLLVQGKGKTEKDAFVMLLQTACEAVTHYLHTRKINPEALTPKQAAEPLFLGDGNNNRGERLTTRSISQIIKNALRAIGIDAREYTAHSLRHTVGTLILEKGGSLLQAQQTLRHANPATTQIYAREALEKKRISESGEAVLEAFFSQACCNR